MKTRITPLFLPLDTSESMGKQIVTFASDDYNKSDGHALIDAKNDAEAISAFLREYRDSPETLRSYAKEVERLLLWCIHIGKVNISSLRRDHMVEYQAFLQKPEPVDQWCGPKAHRQRKDGSVNPNWKPFFKALSPTSVKKSIKIIDSFLNYLVQTNYLTGNPLAVDRRRKRRINTVQNIVDRYLELDELLAVLDALDEHPAENEKTTFHIARARYIVLLLFYSGLRIAEASKHTMGNFIQREKNWFFACYR